MKKDALTVKVAGTLNVAKVKYLLRITRITILL